MKVRKDGEGTITKYGYLRKSIKGKFYLEHRLVMEGMIGRRLIKGEVVHHKDKNRLNNSPENLELISVHSDHVKHYHRKPTIYDWKKVVLTPGTPIKRTRHKGNTCFFIECPEPIRTRGLCRKHYDSFWHWKSRNF